MTDPVNEVIEYVKRDLLNLAIRNTDNHARNTAVQQLGDGTVRLTPVFDIAPMFMDREMIVRASRWLDKHGQVINNFADVIEELPLENEERNAVMLSIESFFEVVEGLPLTMEECGVDADIIDLCKAQINLVCESIDKGGYVEKNGWSR